MPNEHVSKQWRIELLYRYKQAKAIRITVLNIRQLYLYFVSLWHQATPNFVRCERKKNKNKTERNETKNKTTTKTKQNEPKIKQNKTKQKLKRQNKNENKTNTTRSHSGHTGGQRATVAYFYILFIKIRIKSE